MQEVLSQGTILRWLDNFWIDGLWKVLMKQLFPVSPVAAKEYIAKLSKAGHLIQVQFFRCMDEL